MVPKKYLLAAVFGLIAICLWILPDYGMSWDEPVRWNGGDRKLEYYVHLLTGSEEARAAQARRDLYPGFFDLNLAILRRALPWSDWMVSRFFNLLFGLLGIAGTYLLAERLRTGAGLWAAAFLTLYPGWFGHMFINPKDIPFASMYVWSLWALARFVAAENRRASWRWLGVFSVIAGLTAATRVPGLILFAYLALAMVGLTAMDAVANRWRPAEAGKRLGLEALRGALAVAIGFCVLLPWWPYLHGNPFARTAEAVSGVTHFQWEFPVFFWGEFIPAQDLPLTYLPTWILLTTPLVLIGVGAFALAQFRSWLAQSESLRVGAPGARRLFLTALIAFSILFPVTYILVTNATLYNGLRHVLFLVPPTLALVAAGWSRWLDTGWPARSARNRQVIYALLALGYLPVLINMVRLHPYQYTYFNEIAGGVSTAQWHFETEYWGTSYKEAAEKLIAFLEETEASGQFIVNMEHPTWLMTHHIPEEWRDRLRIVRSQGEPADFFVANTVWHTHTWWAGEVVGTVERTGALFCVIRDRRHLRGAEREMFFEMD